MPLEWIEKDAKVIRVRATGTFSGGDMQEVQTAITAAIGSFGGARGLIILDNFEGWAAGESWGDLSFQQEHDREIERLAVVGEERWREDILAFLMAPFRSTDVRFFETHEIDRANAWLTAP